MIHSWTEPRVAVSVQTENWSFFPFFLAEKSPPPKNCMKWEEEKKEKRIAQEVMTQLDGNHFVKSKKMMMSFGVIKYLQTGLLMCSQQFYWWTELAVSQWFPDVSDFIKVTWEFLSGYTKISSMLWLQWLELFKVLFAHIKSKTVYIGICQDKRESRVESLLSIFPVSDSYKSRNCCQHSEQKHQKGFIESEKHQCFSAKPSVPWPQTFRHP